MAMAKTNKKRTGNSLDEKGLDFFSFDQQNRTRIIFGENAIKEVGEMAMECQGTKVLLVTDAGIVKVGHAGRVKKFLESKGLQVSLFSDVHENPTTKDVENCLGVARQAGVDLIVGLGGGSSMDTAKGCNFLLTNGGKMQDYWGVGKATKPMLPFIAIPTTAGTGSECQSFALIADEKTHQKMACGDTKAAARVAILDPLLTLSQPHRVAVCSGVDAISHALETAVTLKRNSWSGMFSREAFRLCFGSMPEILSNPKDVRARGNMLLGAALAGCAIENSMLGAAPAAANPLTARYDILHGQAVGMMLPHVMRFNSKDKLSRSIYAELAASMQLGSPDGNPDSAASDLILRLEEVLHLTRLPMRLRDCGVEKTSLSDLALRASKQWTASFNPRSIDKKGFLKLYQEAY